MKLKHNWYLNIPSDKKEFFTNYTFQISKCCPKKPDIKERKMAMQSELWFVSDLWSNENGPAETLEILFVLFWKIFFTKVLAEHFDSYHYSNSRLQSFGKPYVQVGLYYNITLTHAAICFKLLKLRAQYVLFHVEKTCAIRVFPILVLDLSELDEYWNWLIMDKWNVYLHYPWSSSPFTDSQNVM